MLGEILIAGMAAMLICIFLGPKFIEYLRLREFGQQIREEGPEEHHEKAGTPTMGGLIVFTAISIPYMVLSDRETQSLAVFGVALGCAAIGFADDSLDIPDWLYPVTIFLVIAGSSNAVNLTDGLDGLAAGCCAIVLLAYIAITFITSGEHDLSLLSATLVGGCIGFLWFNAFPASIFMGDTGSLGLGGAIGAMAVMTQTEILLIIIGGIFVIEVLSVALQVATFKMLRRRVLLMAPVHHHFELLAWSETKIMLRFWIVAAVCAGIGFTLYQQAIGT